MPYLNIPSNDSKEAKTMSRVALLKLCRERSREFEKELKDEHKAHRERDSMLIQKIEHMLAAYSCDMNAYNDEGKVSGTWDAKHFIPHENPILAQIQHILLTHEYNCDRLTKLPKELEK